MFPTAHSTVYTNEAGEPIGWSDESQNDPYDPDDEDTPAMTNAQILTLAEELGAAQDSSDHDNYNRDLVLQAINAELNELGEDDISDASLADEAITAYIEAVKADAALAVALAPEGTHTIVIQVSSEPFWNRLVALAKAKGMSVDNLAGDMLEDGIDCWEDES